MGSVHGFTLKVKSPTLCGGHEAAAQPRSLSESADCFHPERSEQTKYAKLHQRKQILLFGLSKNELGAETRVRITAQFRSVSQSILYYSIY